MPCARPSSWPATSRPHSEAEAPSHSAIGSSGPWSRWGATREWRESWGYGSEGFPPGSCTGPTTCPGFPPRTERSGWCWTGRWRCSSGETWSSSARFSIHETPCGRRARVSRRGSQLGGEGEPQTPQQEDGHPYDLAGAAASQEGRGHHGVQSGRREEGCGAGTVHLQRTDQGGQAEHARGERGQRSEEVAGGEFGNPPVDREDLQEDLVQAGQRSDDRS